MTLQAIGNISLNSLLDTLVSLLVAFGLGSMIGFERQARQRTAGLRTNVLVAVGAAIFVDLANRVGGRDAAVHVVAYVVSGIGFLGAGVIMREEGNVRGLNTAATLWGSAAVGACAGADLALEAMLACAFVLAANTLLRPVANRINRRPMDTPDVEVTNCVSLIAPMERRKDAMHLLETELEQANLPARGLHLHAFGAADVEITAVLMATSIERRELDRVVDRLMKGDYVSQASWSPSTSE